MWNKHHWKPTGNWQKGSCTTKAVRKLHRQPGKKGRRDWIWTYVAGRDSEEKGDCLGRHLASGVSGEIRRLGAPFWGSAFKPPLLEVGETLGLQEGWGKPGLCSWGGRVPWLHPEAGQKQICSGSQVFLSQHAQAKWVPWPHSWSQHSTESGAATGRERTWRTSGPGDAESTRLGWRLGGCWWSSLVLPQLIPWCMLRVYMGPAALQCGCRMGGRGRWPWRLGTAVALRDKEGSHSSLWVEWGTPSQHTGDSPDPCLGLPSDLSWASGSCRPRLLQPSTSLGQMAWGWESGEHQSKESRANPGPNIQALL